jgi:pimeloyl-ACP methyl ester carboxylesterase
MSWTMSRLTCWASRGAAGWQFALSRPGRVRRLVLVATGTGALMVPGDPRVLLKMLTPRRHQDRGYAARIVGKLYGGSARRDPAVARDLLHLTSRLGPARGYYYQLLSGIGWTSLPHLWRLRQPTLILAGDDDPIIPLVNVRIMHRLIPDSTLHVYSGGHLELAVDTERIVRVVEAFLSPEEPRMAQVASEHSGNRSGRTSSEVTGLPGEIIEERCRCGRSRRPTSCRNDVRVPLPLAWRGHEHAV